MTTPDPWAKLISEALHFMQDDRWWTLETDGQIYASADLANPVGHISHCHEPEGEEHIGAATVDGQMMQWVERSCLPKATEDAYLAMARRVATATIPSATGGMGRRST
ncbi:hypothetical protein [Alkalilimnicola ehrlichii]|uniref:hypothetical protein n=1 Tax=Alkalilimnicola ehrlichii TaxID=351052 RepID=UPI003BA3303B